MSRRVGNTYTIKLRSLTFRKSLCRRCWHWKKAKRKKTYSPLLMGLKEEVPKRLSLELLQKSVNHNQLRLLWTKVAKTILPQWFTTVLHCICQRSLLSVRRWVRGDWTSRRVSSLQFTGSRLTWTQSARTRSRSRWDRGQQQQSRQTSKRRERRLMTWSDRCATCSEASHVNSGLRLRNKGTKWLR